MFCQVVGKRIVVGKHHRQFRPECDAGGARQGRKVNHQFGLLRSAFVEGVRKNEAALRVGVSDLDRNARAAVQHIKRTEGVPRNAVLNRRDQDAQPHRQACHHDHTRQAECGRGTAHILLHQLHTGRRLQVEAAAVKTDSLTDDRHFRIARLAPPNIDQPGRAVGRAAHCMYHRVILLEQVVADDDAELRLELSGQFTRRAGQLRRPHVRGRRVDEITGQRDGTGGAQDGTPIRLGRPDEFGLGRVDLRVAVEAVCAERPAQRGIGRLVFSHTLRDGVTAGRQRINGRAPRPHIVGVVHTQKRAGQRTAVTRQQQRLTAACGKIRGLDPSRRLLTGLCQPRSKPVFVERGERDRFTRGTGDKIEWHDGTPGIDGGTQAA